MTRHRPPPQISLLVPFRADRHAPARLRSWLWLRAYWKWELPDAEVVIGVSSGHVFSKTQAINDAVSKSHGRILVLLDSDCYMDGQVLQHCADVLDESMRRHQRMWFIPYRHLYRITRATTRRILASNPRHPVRLPVPPDWHQYDHALNSSYGNRYGAMVTVMPRAAFETVGGMDSRFRGWGGEDVAFVRAVDTLWGSHKTTPNGIAHLWHPTRGTTYKDRMWGNQDKPRPNEHLAYRYHLATGDRERMRHLVDEAPGRRRPWWRRFITWL